ncbi:SdpI family protein [Glaciihabitans sp. dw_435]|uniref:SdpI family protein n=1 Tax=Glaciihabitans sp. dw_435 TaxID=2720081 RepID=UPI001BD42224|nr:SdpI family protein [Glaciihabitans sp. dw_435]
MGVVIIMAVAAVIVFVVVILCSNGVIRRNHVVGLRIPAVLASDDSWREGHRVAVVPTGVGVAVSVIVVLACWLDPALRDAGPAIAVATLVIPLVWAAIRANRLA